MSVVIAHACLNSRQWRGWRWPDRESNAWLILLHCVAVVSSWALLLLLLLLYSRRKEQFRDHATVYNVRHRSCQVRIVKRILALRSIYYSLLTVCNSTRAGLIYRKLDSLYRQCRGAVSVMSKSIFSIYQWFFSILYRVSSYHDYQHWTI